MSVGDKTFTGSESKSEVTVNYRSVFEGGKLTTSLQF